MRELRNVVERLVIMSDEVIREKDLPPYLGGPRAGRRAAARPARRPRSTSAATPARACASSARRSSPSSSASSSAEFEWNISRTAQALGIERTNLHKKLRALGIHRGEDDKAE